MKTLKVVVGILFNVSGEVLIAKRQDYDNMWEFPGGKIEHNETPEQALSRELEEEISISANDFTYLIDTQYVFPDREVYIKAYVVNSFTGEVSGAEGQLIKWENIAHLENYPFPGANVQIIKELREKYQSWI